MPGAVFSCTIFVQFHPLLLCHFSVTDEEAEAQEARVACRTSQGSRVSEAGGLAQPHTPGSCPSGRGEPLFRRGPVLQVELGKRS